MLKWAVYGKKNGENLPNDLDVENHLSYNNDPYGDDRARRSLDANSIKQIRKPARYQRRSLGSHAKRGNVKSVDKENIDYIGNTPNFYKEGFVTKKPDINNALKDVSNVTPTAVAPVGATASAQRRLSDSARWYRDRSVNNISPNLTGASPTYSRKIREAKKRKLEMTRGACKDDVSVLPSLYNGEGAEEHRLQKYNNSNDAIRSNANIKLESTTLILDKEIKNSYPISTTKLSGVESVEIEYSSDEYVMCRRDLPLLTASIADERTTLPIFGSKIFLENPLYFNNNKDECRDGPRPLKRSKKRSNEFESSFKSPSMDKQDVHALIRQGLSPVSLTPLSTKLADLRFSTMRCRGHEHNRNPHDDKLMKNCTEFSLAMIKDEEVSAEMENKFIIPGELTTAESTVSDSQMGDKTLEKMIEDIIKSTKKVKSKRKILQEKQNQEIHGIASLRDKEELKEPAEDLVFVRLCSENKNNLIREARYVNLSRENSMSPKHFSSKSSGSLEIKYKRENFLERLIIPNECNRSFILDDQTQYNEREVKTPDNKLSAPLIEDRNKSSEKKVERSLSFSVTQSEKSNLKSVSSESTPNLYIEATSKYRLKRQKCVRRKKSTASNESSWRPRDVKIPQSMLTLEMGIPSPCSADIRPMSICDPLSSSFNCFNGIAHFEIDDGEYVLRSSNRSSIDRSVRSNVSHSSMLLHQTSSEKSSRHKPKFGLTLENGIPSPITPVLNLKRANSDLSDDRMHKSSKLDEDFLRATDALTPFIEYKTSRRCLTFSPEDGSIESCEEKRSIASSKHEGSSERAVSTKGTIDLHIVTRNGVVDVHVIRCRDLQRSCGKTDEINAYAKALISGTTEYQPFGNQRSVFQRTSVLYGKREPEFQRHLKLPLPNTLYDHQLIHVSVWHRDKKYRRSEFLGCVSFPLKDAVKSDISGCYYLSQVSARQPAPAAPPAPAAASEEPRRDERRRGLTRDAMATDNTDAANTNDGDKDSTNNKVATANGPGATNAVSSVHAALQREADEHLFLRYLELDPQDGPESTPTPRRSGSRQGRTPFTTTRRLARTGGCGGFGFTVVWTRPPRVERVVAGGPAERAGVRAGDYLVFVGNKNVVTAPEEQVRQLVKSAGPTLVLETFRRTAPNGLLSSGPRPRGSTASHLTVSDVDAGRTLEPLSESLAPSMPSAAPSASAAPSGSTVRPGTACSAATSQSLDVTAARRKLHLPQVTFSKEAPALTHEQQRRRALLAVVAREQHYATCLQFGLVRFVAPLGERSDLITPADHQLLFQNIEEILRLSEDILDQVVHEDGEIQTSTVVAVYLQKTSVFLSLYKKYCLGLKRADCVLVKKSRDPSGAFVRFCTSPPLPRRRPDITSLVHKPLEQFRELLRLMRAAAAAGGGGGSGYDQYERRPLQAIADQLQTGYQEVTAGSGLMGLAGDGKPLLSVADLESRLVFTRCKPFVLGTPGRQWIFGGELSRVEGRTVKPYWALLFSDLLLFATVSRDRVLFITEEPVALATVSDACFNVRKKATEFRLTLGRAGGESPLVSCSPRVLPRARGISLRAPSLDLKAVWQSLLQRQIYRVHTMSGTPLGSPLDSPDPQLAFSLATLDSQQRQTQRRRSSAEAGGGAGGAGGSGAGAEGAGARKGGGRGASLHLAHWMTQLPEREECEPPEHDLQFRRRELQSGDGVVTPEDKHYHTEESDPAFLKTWSVEELRKRSQELNLIDVAGIVGQQELIGKTTSPHDKNDNERSPSKSSSDSQITVRTSPVVVDTIPVCRQCHKKCFSKPNSPLVSQKETKPVPKVTPEKISPQKTNSNSSACSASCANCKTLSSFNKLDRKGAIKVINPKDAPKAAMKVIDSIAQNQKKLKSTSYNFDTDSPLLSRKSTISDVRPSSARLLLERRTPVDLSSSIRSPSPCGSSRNNSPLSTSHTTCSSMVLNSSANDLRTSSPCMPASVQCVIAQEKYINEVKCVENVVLTKNKSLSPSKKDKLTRQRAESVLNKVLGMNIITKRENVSGCLRSSSVFLEDNSIHEDENDYKMSPGKSSSIKKTPELKRVNGDVKRKDLREDLNANKGSDVASDEDLEWRPLMLMGLSAINPAAHLMRMEPSALRRPGALESSLITTAVPVPPNIAVVPPTPDYSGVSKSNELVDDSPDSPQPEDPPYVSLKRYGTMSSLERIPSDETDDGKFIHEPDTSKIFAAESTATGTYGSTSGGLMGWTARAGSFVVEKMNIFSYTETVQTTVPLSNKQPSFLERYLGVGEWRGGVGAGEDVAGGAETGEGSGASGEEAWGTPSSGELSDNAFPDSEHGTLSSPTKSSSSYAGDDDTELMMDELLMAPTITGPTLRPLLPRSQRRLEPLLEEEYSDSGSEDNKATPTAPDTQGSAAAGACGRPADVCCAVPPLTDFVSASEGGPGAGGRGAGAPRVCGGAGGAAERERLRLQERQLSDSTDTTPTNETPAPVHSTTSRAASKDLLEARWFAGGAAAVGAATAGGAGRRGSASSASTPSTLERTAIHNPSPPPLSSNDNQTESEPEDPEAPPLETQRLSPRAEMRLALDQGKDMLADQDDRWSRVGELDPWSWRAACQRSLLRRVASADAVTLCRPLQPQPLRTGRAHQLLSSPHAHRTAPDTTSRSSVYAWRESDKGLEPMEMERLAQVEARTMRSRTRSQCQNGKILGFLRRRASSDSPRRTDLSSLMSAGPTQRPFSPRRTTVSNNGYYKICFVNGSV